MNQRRKFLRYLGVTGSGLLVSSWALGDNDDDSHGRGSDGDSHGSGNGNSSSGTSGSTPKVPGATGASGRVVVIGGGMGGASVAKYLRLWGGVNVQVTLIEREASYASNIMSNLVLTGQMTMQRLTYGYDALRRNYGINVVQGTVVGIDPVSRQVSLADGSKLAYDRLVIAPGIEFDTLPGLESVAAQAAIPHAWKAGAQTDLLRDQIRAMPAGGTFVMTIPAAPYRCPPGPYERACLVADYLKRNKPGSKVIVLDGNPDIVAERATFSLAFNTIHADVIEYHPSVAIRAVDPTTRTLQTDIGNIRGDVLNVIPPQRAGRIIADSGLNSVGGRWAGVDVLSYESNVVAGVHVIGDAAGTTQPKAGHIANAEAKVCADAIFRGLQGFAPHPSPVTNSACYSPITMNTASWLTAVFAYDPASRTMKVIPGASGEAARPSSGNYKDMGKWFGNLMGDTFA